MCVHLWLSLSLQCGVCCVSDYTCLVWGRRRNPDHYEQFSHPDDLEEEEDDGGDGGSSSH